MSPRRGRRLRLRLIRAYIQEARRAYRDLFITASGMGSALAGTILHRETLYQSTVGDDKPFVECLREAGILPGVKVDEVKEGELLGKHSPSQTKACLGTGMQGLAPLEESSRESHTRGLENLASSCESYKR